MNRSTKGFGLMGVAIVVVLMLVTAVFSSSANSDELTPSQEIQQS